MRICWPGPGIHCQSKSSSAEMSVSDTHLRGGDDFSATPRGREGRICYSSLVSSCFRSGLADNSAGKKVYGWDSKPACLEALQAKLISRGDEAGCAWKRTNAKGFSSKGILEPEACSWEGIGQLNGCYSGQGCFQATLGFSREKVDKNFCKPTTNKPARTSVPR